MLGFFFTSTHVSKANWIVVRLRCATNSGDDIPGALGWQWHFSGQFEQFFVCSNWCLQKLLIFQKKHGNPMSRDGVSGVSRACLGRVSACLGMVSRGVLAWLGVVSREKKHDLHLSYTTKRTKAQGTIKSGLPLKKNNKWKYYRSWTPKKQKIKTDYRWEAIKNKADHRSETQRKTKFKSKNDSKSNIF
jgi:hypothetical protein